MGFIQCPEKLSDPQGTLAFNFGDFELFACHTLNRFFEPTVMLSGVITTGSSIADMRCEMPVNIESFEQGMAWVAWCIDQNAGKQYLPRRSVPWLSVGRKYRSLLPWEKDRAAYKERPRCAVRRDFAQVGLRQLAENIALLPDDAVVSFAFDGEAFAIRAAEKLVVMPAEGRRWPRRFGTYAENIRKLPKRLTKGPVLFSIQDGSIEIGNRKYPELSAVVERDLDER